MLPVLTYTAISLEGKQLQQLETIYMQNVRRLLKLGLSTSHLLIRLELDIPLVKMLCISQKIYYLCDYTVANTTIMNNLIFEELTTHRLSSRMFGPESVGATLKGI